MGFWDGFQAVGNAAGAMSGNAAGSMLGGGSFASPEALARQKQFGVLGSMTGGIRNINQMPVMQQAKAQWASMSPEQQAAYTASQPAAMSITGQPVGQPTSGGPVSSTTSPGMMGPNGQPMIPPGPNQTTFAQANGQQPNPNAPYAGINTGGGQYPLSSVQGTGFLAPFNAAFNRPDPNQIANDPSFKFQMEQGTEALERSALARGTALGGGQMKELARFGQGLANTFDDKYYNRAKGEYDTARDIFNQNKNSQYDVLSGQANRGMQAAGGQADIAQGQGNAQAAGTIRTGSAYGNLVNNAGQIGASAYDQWDYNRQQNANAQPNFNPFVQQGPYSFPGQQYGMGQNPGRIPNNWTGGPYTGPTNPYVQSYG